MGRVQFVVGRAGAGKTTWVADAVVKDLEQSPLGGPLYWLVPEGASYVAERLLMRRVQASVRAEVLSLRRFANAVLQRTPSDVRPLTTAGRRLLLHAVLSETSYDGELKFLRSSHLSPSKLDVVLAAFDELEQTAIDFNAFQPDVHVVPEGGGLWGQKSQDICALYVRYRAALRAAGSIDTAQLLCVAQSHLAEDLTRRPARVWIDDFRVFTPRECAFIAELADAAEHTVVTLPLDPTWVLGAAKRNLPVALEPVYRSFVRLTDALTRRGVAWDLLALPDAGDADRAAEAQRAVRTAELLPRFREAPAVAAVERILTGVDPQVSRHSSGEPLVMAAAQNRRTEVEGVAREIRHLLRRRGVSPADIAVVMVDREGYADIIDNTFARYNIPHTVDDYPSLAGHPLGRFLLAVLDVVERAFDTGAVKRLLKTEFHGLDADEADWLDVYVDKYGVDGGQDWLSPEDWSFGSDSSDREHATANRLRRQILSVVEPLYQSLASDSLLAVQVANALWDCLERAGTKRTIAKWLVSDELASTPGQASLHEQAWTRVVEVLSDLAEAGGNTAHERSLLLTLVRDELEALPLSSIPAGLNQVLVTDLRRAHGWEADYVFIVGVGDGMFPARAHDFGLWNDDDRTGFHGRFGVELGDTLEQAQALRWMDVYFTLTRVKTQLWLSYPLADADGKAARPASLMARLKAQLGPEWWLDKLWVRIDDVVSLATADVAAWTPDQAIAWVAAAWRTHPTRTTALLTTVERWLTAHADEAARLETVRQGRAHRPLARPLLPSTARALYGDPLVANVHQLESYAACPYQHFARFGLRLHTDDVLDFNSAARGTLLHDALQLFVTHQAERLDQWRQQSDDDVIRLVRQLFETTLEQQNTVFRTRKPLQKHQMNEAFRILELAAVVLTSHARHGAFSPAAVELAFGDGAVDGDDGVRIDLGDDRTLLLRGRIDRVDIHQVDGKSVFRVIDYKSRQMVLNLDRIYHGLQLQLPVYAHVVERMSEQWFGQASQAVGLLYLPLVRKAEIKSAPIHEGVARSTALKQMRVKGWMLADPKFVGLMDARLVQGQESELFARVLKNDGTFAANAPVVTEDAWQGIRAHVVQLVQQFGRNIADGQIEIAPYDFGKGDTACRFCDYASLCQIDRRPNPQLFRRLGRRPSVWPAQEVRG